MLQQAIERVGLINRAAVISEIREYLVGRTVAKWRVIIFQKNPVGDNKARTHKCGVVSAAR